MSRVGYNASYDFTRNGEIATCRPFLPKAPVLIEIGANNGDWGARFLKQYPLAKAYLVEANPKLAVQLKVRFKSNPNVTIVDAAISNTAGSATFHIPGDKDTHASLERIEIGRTGYEMEEIAVNTLTGEKLMSNYGIDHADFLKVDVEGHELNVFKGFAKPIEQGRIRNLQFEYSEINLEKRVYLKDFFEFLQRYEIGRIYPDTIDFKDYDLSEENFIPGNFFAKLSE